MRPEGPQLVPVRLLTSSAGAEATTLSQGTINPLLLLLSPEAPEVRNFGQGVLGVPCLWQ